MSMDLKVLQNDINKINVDLLEKLDKRSALIKKFNADNARQQRNNRLNKKDENDNNSNDNNDGNSQKTTPNTKQHTSVPVVFDATLTSAVEKYSGSYTAAQMKTIVDAIDKATETLINKGVVVGFLNKHKDNHKSISQKAFNYTVEADFSQDSDELMDKLENGDIDYAVMPTVSSGAYYHATVVEYLVEPHFTILKEVNIYDRNAGHSGFLVLGSRPADAQQTLITSDGKKSQGNNRRRGQRGRGRNGGTISPTAPNPYKSLILAFTIVAPQTIERTIALLEGAGITMEELHSINLSSGNYFYIKCKPSREVTNISFVENNLRAITTSLHIYAI